MSLYVQIEKRLGGFRLRAAFESDGNVLGLLGPSGCGKSLTLKCVAGVERPDAGRIVLNGVTLFDSRRHIDLPPQRRGVGCLFQNYALFPNMTVEQNILCGLRWERDRRKRTAALNEILGLMELEGLERLRPSALSGGQAQRTALARILVNRPRLLMLDEPFSALDAYLRDKLQADMKALLSRLGTEAIMVTHSRDEAYHLCGRVAVMDAGRVLTVRETKALFADPGSIRAAELTGCKNIAPARKTGGHTVEVPGWGVELATAQPVGDGLAAVGVRAHSFTPGAGQNLFPVAFVGGMEEPFEWAAQFRFSGQLPDTPPLWWRVPKDRMPEPRPECLGVAPENVLLLYQ